ncbi:MAG: STAS/SEC14 domain-containing protein [Anaerolineae bacterium]
MPVVQVEAQLSTDELLKAVKQLSQPELERFASQVIVLTAQRRAPTLPQAEAELLLKINRGVPPDVQKRYGELIVKRQAESLMPDEYDELLRLSHEIEDLEARRVEYLAELARLRGTSLATLMENLGIRPPEYA